MKNCTLGLDIGISSVGVAGVAMDQQKILFTGVHLFEAAENPKTGASLAEPRRNKRGLRRVIHRRGQRKRQIRALLAAHGIEGTDSIDLSRSGAVPVSVWALREHALRRPLAEAELARVLFHIAKRRGYQSNRKDQTATEKSDENKKVLKGATDLKKAWEQSGCATIGAYLATLPKQRNGDGTYENMVIREWLRDEVDTIFAAQQRLGNAKATNALRDAFKDKAFTQRPLQSFADKVGPCELFRNEKRAPKHAPSAELFVLWSRLNNLRIRYVAGRDEEPLSLDDKLRIADLALKQAKVTGKQIRKLLALGDEARFNISYRKTKPDQDTWEKIRDSAEEKTIFAELKGYHALKSALYTGSDTDWLNRFHAQRAQLDTAARILSFENDEQVILSSLREAGFTDAESRKLGAISNFSKAVGLSLRAINVLLPFMQQGLMYSDAVTRARADGLLPEPAQHRLSLLPPFGNTNNPVVNRALAQARKVLNACIRKYGLPETIIIELARDVGKPFEERRKIEKKIAANQAERDAAAQHFAELTGKTDPRGGDILKHRLWKEQGGYCAYSGVYIDPAMLRDDTAVQVDHILPYSRTFDDSYMNKVLVLAGENQRKGNRTPVEYFRQEGRDVAALAAFVHQWRLPKAKGDRLLREELGHSSEQGFKERNLNDTRYMARLLKNHIEEHLDLGKGRRVQVRNGALTAHLRGGWGFPDKNRRNDRHHALDAIVLACSTESMVQEFTRWNRYQARQEQMKPYPPAPWETFRADALASVDTIFVSRMPVRKITGAAHEDTIRRLRATPEGERQVIQRVKLGALKLSTLEKMVDAFTVTPDGEVRPGRNYPLYQILQQRLLKSGDKADKAFAEPVFMPGKDPAKPGPRVHAVRILTSEKSGVEINGGLASNGDMVRTDVFCKNGKYYLCPVYVHHFAGGVLPNRVVKAHTPEDQWPEIEDDFFLFSLSKNDLVRIRTKETAGKKSQDFFAYFNTSHRANGSIEVRAHDNDPSFGNQGLKSGIGVQNLLIFEKYTVNYFGDKHRIIKEKRLGVARASHPESRPAVAASSTAAAAE